MTASRRTTDPLLAGACLASGGLVALPTETVYGLGARADLPHSVARVFEAKGRPTFDPLISHFATPQEALDWVVFDDRALALAEAFWPGPLTLVLPRRTAPDGRRICDLATSGLPTCAVRVPDHRLAREALAVAGGPIAAPSANLFGRTSPTRAEHVIEDLGDRTDLVLDGGPCLVGVESTVLSLVGIRPRLLRPGGVCHEDLKRVLGVDLMSEPVEGGANPEAPGMLPAHYSPGVAVEAFDDAKDLTRRAQELDGNCVLLLWTHVDARARERVRLALGVAFAAGLFESLRMLARHGLPVLAHLPPPQGLGLAVRDRLLRAAAARVPQR